MRNRRRKPAPERDLEQERQLYMKHATLWAERGDVILVYECVAMDTPNAGRRVMIPHDPVNGIPSLGSLGPDTPQFGCGWKLRLIGVAKSPEAATKLMLHDDRREV